MLFGWFDHDKARCISLGREVMRTMEDELARMPGMERGTPSDRKHLDNETYKMVMNSQRIARELANSVKKVKSLQTMIDNLTKHHYPALLYTLLTAFGADVSAEESTAQGRSDIVLRMPKTIYILEIKYDQTADEALRQIADKDYTGKYRLDSRPVVKVALHFSSKTRNIAEWKSEYDHPSP